MEEENTTKTMKEGDLEMGITCDELVDTNNEESDDLKAKRYQKVESLPKPLMTRIYSMPKMAMKSLSFNSNMLIAAV